MTKTDTGIQPRQSRHLLACAGLLTLLAGCGGGGGDEPEFGPGTSPIPGSRNITGATDGGTGAGSGGPDAVTLVRSSLDITSKLVAVSNIVNAMLHDHIDLVQTGDTNARNIPQCAASPDGYDFETNQVSYRHLNPGFMLPAGPSLHVALSRCIVEGVDITGFIDITNIRRSGDPGGNGDWEIEAEVWLSPAQIHNNNGTVTSLTDSYTHSARRTLNVLNTRLEIDADLNAGIIGGLNGQHYALPLTPGSATVNFQFRPFRIDTTEDSDAGEYRLEIASHGEGPSTLSRYTNGGDDEVLMRVETQADDPLLWTAGRPASYTQTPVSGAVMLEETCTDCDTVQVAVASGEAILTVESGGSVTSSVLDWSLLLSPPPPP